MLFPLANAPGRITLVEQPGGMGVVHHTIALEGGPSVSFTQLALP
jgi:hypothetical protein